MLANVTNRSKAPRGFVTLDRGTVVVEPAGSALLDLADHPLHGAWADERAITLAVLPDKDAKAARRRIEQQNEILARAQAEALAGLPNAASGAAFD